MSLVNIEDAVQVILDEIGSQTAADTLAINQVIFKETISTPLITTYLDLRTGITCGHKIPYGDKKRGFDFMPSAESLSSGCEYNECDVKLEMSSKPWETHKYNCKLKYCQADLSCDFMKWWENNTEYCNVNNPTQEDYNNAFTQFLIDWYSSALIDSHYTKAFFGNSTATDGTLGSDGIFVQMATIAPDAVTAPKQRIEIPENDAATYADQLNLAADRGFEVYKELHDKMMFDPVFGKDASRAVIYTTRTLAVNYWNYLVNNNQVNCCYKEDVTVGRYDINNLNIFGLPIVIIDEWDYIIQEAGFTSLDDGTKYTDPHRAYISYKENLPIGTCRADRLDTVKVLYNPYDEQMQISASFEMGVSVLREDRFVLAM